MTTLENFTNTSPADRKATEEAILRYHGYTKAGRPLNVLRAFGSGVPQFIWCGSPQSCIVMAKLVGDLHEGATPSTPKHSIRGGGQVPNWQTTATNSAGRIIRWGTAPSTPFGTIFDQIAGSLTMNPNTDLYSYEGHTGFDIIQRALDSSSPQIGAIKLHPDYIGRRLTLEETHLGQHYSGEEETNPGHDFAEKLASLCGWVWDYGTHIFISERTSEFHFEPFMTTRELWLNRQFPVAVARTVQGIRLHNTGGPAVAWPDGNELYAIHGVVVPDFVVNDPRRITRYKINHERNQEVRRILIDRYKLNETPSGPVAYMLDSGARTIDHDEVHGTLHYLPRQALEPEEMVVLEVVNSTPEPDGSFKHYFLRVPPQIRSSLEARAWTFGINPDEFQLIAES